MRAKTLTHPMNSKLILLFLMLMGTPSVEAGVGFFGNFYFITSTGGPNVYSQITTGNTPGTNAGGGHSLASDGINPAFSSLGSYTAGTTWTLKGFEYKTYENGGDFVLPASINYRIYKVGDTPGSFNQVSTSSFSINGGDRTWSKTDGTTNLLAGLTNGEYRVELFSQAQGNYSGGDFQMFGFTSNGNPVGTFSVVPEPSRALLCLLGGVVLFLRRRR